MNISKVYEDDNILVVNKPAGLITHPKNINDTQPALTDWVAANYPELKNVGEPFSASGFPLPRHGIVHRLDKDTSGLIVIAKDQASFDFMKKQFQGHTIQKHYYALVYGTPKEKTGVINAPLGRIGMKRTTQIGGKKMIDGKESMTEYKVAKRFEKYSLLDVSPKTGRTHQIRVHLKSIGHPIAGDIVYSPKGWSRLPSSKNSTRQSRILDSRSESGQRYMPPGLTRMFLHAYKLEFPAPDGKRLTLETDLPEDLQKVLEDLPA